MPERCSNLTDLTGLIFSKLVALVIQVMRDQTASELVRRRFVTVTDMFYQRRASNTAVDIIDIAREQSA